MDDSEKAKKLLSNYKKIKSEYEIKLIDVQPEYPISSVSIVETGSTDDSQPASKVEDYLMRYHEDNKDILKRKKIIDIVNSALNCLTQEKKKAIQKIYFEDKKQVAVADRLGWSEATISRRHEEAIEEMIEVGLLAAYEKWQEVI